MNWIKIKELRMNMDTGAYYKPEDIKMHELNPLFHIDMNGQTIRFDNKEQRDNAIDKLDAELDIRNLFKTDKELGLQKEETE